MRPRWLIAAFTMLIALATVCVYFATFGQLFVLQAKAKYHRSASNLEAKLEPELSTLLARGELEWVREIAYYKNGKENHDITRALFDHGMIYYASRYTDKGTGDGSGRLIIEYLLKKPNAAPMRSRLNKFTRHRTHPGP